MSIYIQSPGGFAAHGTDGSSRWMQTSSTPFEHPGGYPVRADARGDKLLVSAWIDGTGAIVNQPHWVNPTDGSVVDTAPISGLTDTYRVADIIDSGDGTFCLIRILDDGTGVTEKVGADWSVIWSVAPPAPSDFGYWNGRSRLQIANDASFLLMHRDGTLNVVDIDTGANVRQLSTTANFYDQPASYNDPYYAARPAITDDNHIVFNDSVTAGGDAVMNVEGDLLFSGNAGSSIPLDVQNGVEWRVGAREATEIIVRSLVEYTATPDVSVTFPDDYYGWPAPDGNSYYLGANGLVGRDSALTDLWTNPSPQIGAGTANYMIVGKKSFGVTLPPSFWTGLEGTQEIRRAN